MTERKKLLGIFVVVLIIIGGAFYAGFSYGKSQVPSIYAIQDVGNKTLGQPDNVDFSLFWDAWKTLTQKYVGRSNLDSKTMVYGAISGMVKSLGDPYTIFFPPQEAKRFQDDVTGSFSGIGAEIGLRKDIITVISPLEDSPAKKAGLRAGDFVLKIDDKKTDNMSLDEAINLIRGQKGTVVKLTVARQTSPEPIVIAITRDEIKVPVVKWELKNNKVAYVQLFTFSETATEAFNKAMTEILRSPADRIILDLRNNPGGYLEVSQQLSGWFLDNNSLVAIEDYGDGSKADEYRTSGNGAFKNIPMVVLINEGSASAAEIMAGALRDDRGIKLIGAKSFGKGSVQELMGLSQGSLKVTIAKWLTPSKKSIMNEGLEPDVKVDITKDDIDNLKDPQLDKAIEVVSHL